MRVLPVTPNRRRTPISTVTPAPIIAPDLSEASVDTAVAEVTAAVAPVLSAKVRARLYEIGGPVGVIATAVSPVVGGSVGVALAIIGSALAAGVAILARSHTK